MSSWRYMAYRPDGRGHEVLLHPDLPITGQPKVQKVLSGVNSISLEINPKFESLMAEDGRPIFERWGTIIYAERDGDIQGGFILEDMDAEGPKLTLQGVGFLGYAQDIAYTGEFIAYEVDPMDMARFIWSHIQSGTMGNIGLVLDTKDTGGKRTVGIRPVPAFRGRPAITTLPGGKGEVVLPAAPATPAIEDQPFRLAWYESHNLLDDFVKLAQESPFDFREKHWWEGGEVQHFVEMTYPRIGDRKPLLRFAVGENVFEAPKYVMDGSDYASDILLLGAGEGAKMVKGYATDHSQGLLRRTRVVKNGGVGRAATAQAQAQRQLALYQGDFKVTDLVVKNTPMTPYGSFDVGDEIRLVTSEDEWIESGEVWVRVMELEVSPADNDDMNITVERI